MSSNHNTTKSNSNNAIGESVIRQMTRLSQEFNAVNLSQGFPNESPPLEVRRVLAASVLSGGCNESLERVLQRLLSNSSPDVVNQYSPPMGRWDLRQAIADYYRRLYDWRISPDDVTVTLGATEAVGSALRSIGKPGDKVVIMEPFHELYPSQCKIFYLEPVFVTLTETEDYGWKLDMKELDEALKESKILLLNSPHNPTGKVFTRSELETIVHLCLKHDVYIITDEIYEHVRYTETPHYVLPLEFPDILPRTLLCNSIGKSASATGWRVGWCIHPEAVRGTFRAIHDQMVVMAPHPMQVASITYLQLDDSYFRNDLASRYLERIETLGKCLQRVGFQVSMPEGAYYLFVKYTSVPQLANLPPMKAAMYLLEHVGVASVPGDNFYGMSDNGKEYLRFAACRSKLDIMDACQRLNDKLGDGVLPTE
jgi:aspartate/methionine/tyrosine aminotransferase